MEELAEIKRMRCPNALTVAWFEIPPYIYNTSDGKPGGVFYNVLSQMVDFCCPQRTNLSFSENPVKLSQFQGLLDNGTDDILLPIYGDGRKNDRLGEPFISLVDSPGVAFFYGNSGSAQEALINAFLTSWPVLVVVMLFALVVGAGFWVTEIVRDSEARKKMEKRNSIKEGFFRTLQGPWDGFYWAIVTLTTVGYGDLCPKTIGGRLVAMVWILFGTVVLSMFTASITSGLITACLSNDIPLAGTKVAVMSHSKESSIAVKKNAFPFNYDTVQELSSVLERGETEGLLLDSYVAGHYQELFTKFLLADVLEYVFTYGMVLRNEGAWMSRCFRIYLDSKKDQLFYDISKSVKPFKPVKFGNQASEKSSTLIDWKSKPMQYMLIGIGSLLLLLIICGKALERFLKKTKFPLELMENGGKYGGEKDVGNLKFKNKQHINERFAVYSQLENELKGLGKSIQNVITFTKEMEQGAYGGKDPMKTRLLEDDQNNLLTSNTYNNYDSH